MLLVSKDMSGSSDDEIDLINYGSLYGEFQAFLEESC